jgi:putative transcriptional regulator
MENIISGSLLISDPFLKDPNFLRTVVIVCAHQEEGSFGFVLNKRHHQLLGELVEDLRNCKFPVFAGGPVQADVLHFLHQRPDLILGGQEIIDGIYWGGDFDEVVELIRKNMLHENDIRFYVGYSGWGEKQLEYEVENKSWIVSHGNIKLVFRTPATLIWKEALQQLGGEYQLMVNYPTDPQLN